jgi:flagellar hook-associated protein 3 FlgL
MTVRITDNLRLHDITSNLAELRSRQAGAARRASTGLRVEKPSTDPLAASRATLLQSGLERLTPLRTNVTTAIADTDLTESSLTQATEVLNRARELAMQGANGSYNASDRVMLADEVAALKSELVALGNQKGSYGYLFAGHQTQTPAFDSDGNYQGDGGQRRIEVAHGVVLQTNVLGSDVFNGGGSGVDVFAQLTNLEAALRADDVAQVSAGLDGLDGGLEQLTQARSRMGSLRTRLDIALESLDRSEISLTQQHADTVGADPFATLTELTGISTTLEQAISVARSLLTSGNSRF